MKAFASLEIEEFACEKDAIARLDKFKKKCSLLEIDNIEIIQNAKFNGKGRPKKDAKPDYFTYQIRGIVSVSVEKKEKLESKKGFFIIATNELDEEKLSAKELFEAYKNQGKVERGFRFLKDPQFMASTLFLKNPKRIEALMMIMTMRWIFFCFKGIHVIYSTDKKESMVLNLKGEHEKIIRLLGVNFENKYY